VQLREKTLPAQTLTRISKEAVALAMESPGRAAKIIVNDRLDVALAAGAHGVHLGANSMPVAEVVRWLRHEAKRLALATDFLVGRSCHSLEEAQAAERDGAGYIIFGPVFSTPSKMEYGPPHGVARLAEICRAARIPVLAIGGITSDNAAQCFRAGATGIAAIRLFQETPDLAEVLPRLQMGG
jgi:thiamine-phosphate pyrophosphorylase